jgi:heme exporter protein C
MLMATQTRVSPAKTDSKPSFNWGLALTALAGLLIIGNMYMALIFAPTAINLATEVEQYAQRILYIHVGSAWVSFFALFVTGFGGLMYLIKRDHKWDNLSYSSVEIGLMFMTVFLITGSVWAKPTWNTWWTWSPRLTISAISWLMYIGYLMLRGAIDNPTRKAMYAAIYSIVAFISVPINFMAIRWWRDIHPAVVGTAASEGQGGFDMAADMRTALIYSVVAITVFYFVLVYHRMRLGETMHKVELLKQKLLHR